MFPKINEKLLSKAVEILNQGGIVVFPTDTAFGVGCRLDKTKAIQRLFEIKNRPTNQPIAILVNSTEMAKDYWLSLPRKVKKLMNKFWPGGLTIVYPCREDKVPSLVRGGKKNLGVRMPDHEIPLQLIKAVGVPLATTSANFSGQPTPYKFEDLGLDFLDLVDLFIPGKCPVGLVSTVIDCSQKPWKILREGVVKIPGVV